MSAAQAADELGLVLREECGGPFKPGLLLIGAAGFALTALPWRMHPAWALALGLWLGVSLADALAGWGARHLAQRWSLIAWLALSLYLGAAVGFGIEQAFTPQHMDARAQFARAVLHLGFCGLLVGVPIVQGLRRLHALRRLEGERARLTAELQMLQAQIEPHFLFNTLATLRSLVRQGSDQALPLLDGMTGFLEAVLPRVREPHSTLGRELTIVEQYLAIMALRLGPRLAWRIEVPAALHEQPLTPLLLQPLVENAIRHGIEPSEAGGEILLTAHLDGTQLRLCVRNSGAALYLPAAAPGHGLALENLRQRLHALHGMQARFELCAVGDNATEARVTLPT